MKRHRVLWQVSVISLLISVLPVTAIESPPRPQSSTFGKIRDLAVTVRARRALQEDRILGPLNLGVWVENGVASIWGPVPSNDVAQQAVAKLGTVKGVYEVRSDFQVRRSTTDPNLLAELSQGERSLARIDVFKTDGGNAQPSEDRRLSPPGKPQANDGDRDTPRLLAPRPVAAPRRQTEGEVVNRPRPNLADQVEQVRRADPRFRGLVVRLVGTTVEVRRGDGDEAFVLANQLRRIRGITDVILTDD